MPVFQGLRQKLRGGNTGSSRLDDPYRLPVRTIPQPPQVISHYNPHLRNTVPDTPAARKANSPKAKRRALNNVNKNPMNVDDIRSRYG